MRGFFEDLLTRLQSGQPAGLATDGHTAVLAVVIDREGSAPRTAGACMAVFKDGKSLGTVGGGALEARAESIAREVLSEGLARLARFDLVGAPNAALSGETALDACDMDMICGGRVTLLLAPIAPTAEVLAALTGFLDALAGRTRQRGFLVFELNSPESMRGRYALKLRCLTGAEENASMEVASMEDPLMAVRAAAAGARGPILEGGEGAWVAVLPAPRPATLWLLGGGHVALATAELATRLDFRIMVADDRPEYASRERFPMAERLFVPETFENFLAPLDLSEDDCLFIVTRGHRHDATLLEQALTTRAGYVGMIGSRKKRDAIYAELRAKGFTEADLARVRCPVGLAIGAETPEEIAVSVAAELIQHRADKSRIEKAGR